MKRPPMTDRDAASGALTPHQDNGATTTEKGAERPGRAAGDQLHLRRNANGILESRAHTVSATEPAPLEATRSFVGANEQAMARARQQQRSETVALTVEMAAMRTENARLLQELKTLKVHLQAQSIATCTPTSPPSDGSAALTPGQASTPLAHPKQGVPPHSAGPDRQSCAMLVAVSNSQSVPRPTVRKLSFARVSRRQDAPSATVPSHAPTVPLHAATRQRSTASRALSFDRPQQRQAATDAAGSPQPSSAARGLRAVCRAFSFTRGTHNDKTGKDTRPPHPNTSRASTSGAATTRTLALVLGDFDAEGAVELTVRRGQMLVVIQGGGAPIGWSWACSPGGAGLVPTGHLRMLAIPEANGRPGTSECLQYESPTAPRAGRLSMGRAEGGAEGGTSLSPALTGQGTCPGVPRPPPVSNLSGTAVELKQVPFAAVSPSGMALPPLPHMHTASSMGEASLDAAKLQPASCSPIDSPSGSDLSGAASTGELELDVADVHLSRSTQGKPHGANPVRLRATKHWI